MTRDECFEELRKRTQSSVVLQMLHASQQQAPLSEWIHLLDHPDVVEFVYRNAVWMTLRWPKKEE